MREAWVGTCWDAGAVARKGAWRWIDGKVASHLLLLRGCKCRRARRTWLSIKDPKKFEWSSRRFRLEFYVLLHCDFVVCAEYSSFNGLDMQLVKAVKVNVNTGRELLEAQHLEVISRASLATQQRKTEDFGFEFCEIRFVEFEFALTISERTVYLKTNSAVYVCRDLSTPGRHHLCFRSRPAHIEETNIVTRKGK